MAKGKKTGGRNWQKGKSGNPKGSSALARAGKEVSKINKIELEKVLSKYLNLSLNDLKKKLSDKETSALHAMVISLMLHATKQGDPTRINLLFDRLVGKPKFEIEHSGLEGGPIELIELSSEERKVKITENIKRLKITENAS